jgi:hypothetical protein
MLVELDGLNWRILIGISDSIGFSDEFDSKTDYSIEF